MEVVTPFLMVLLAQAQTVAAEAATITINLGAAGGAVAGGSVPVAILTWLGVRKWRNGRNGDGGKADDVKSVLKDLARYMADAKEDRVEDRELRRELLGALNKLVVHGAGMEDRLELVFKAISNQQ